MSDTILEVLEKYKEQMTNKHYKDGIEALGVLRVVPSNSVFTHFIVAPTQEFTTQTFSLSEGSFSKIQQSIRDKYDSINCVSHRCQEYPELRKLETYLEQLFKRKFENV